MFHDSLTKSCMPSIPMDPPRFHIQRLQLPSGSAELSSSSSHTSARRISLAKSPWSQPVSTFGVAQDSQIRRIRPLGYIMSSTYALTTYPCLVNLDSTCTSSVLGVDASPLAEVFTPRRMSCFVSFTTCPKILHSFFMPRKVFGMLDWLVRMSAVHPCRCNSSFHPLLSFQQCQSGERAHSDHTETDIQEFYVIWSIYRNIIRNC